MSAILPNATVAAGFQFGLGLSLGLVPTEAQSLIVAGALISIALNPFVFTAVEPVRAWVLQRSALARRLETREDPTAALPMSTERKYLEGQVVLVGYGRVGRRIAQALGARGIPFVVAEQNREQVERLREQGFAAVPGMLRKGDIARVFFGEEELAKGMASHVLDRFAPGA